MNDPAKPGWPDASALPFSLFGQAAGGGASAQPLAQGLAGGLELIRKFWGNLPGGSALPGFLVPTVDVEELDKRIADLRAAESWLDVNMNMLRATIQGLEVQRHTIAAIQSLSAMSGGAPKKSAAPSAGGLPPGWPQSVPTPAPPAPASAAVPAPVPASAQAAREPAVEPPAAKEAAPVSEAASDATAGTPNLLAGLAANNWLGFMQEQFSKVAQAALSPSMGRAATTAGDAKTATPARKTARKAAPRKAAGRRAPVRKRGES